MTTLSTSPHGVTAPKTDINTVTLTVCTKLND